MDFSINIKQLDDLHLCNDYNTKLRDKLISFTKNDIYAQIYLRDLILITENIEFHLSDYLTVLVRLSWFDLDLRARLIGFLNDLSICCVQEFESVWPEDDLPRISIERTQMLLDERIGIREWYDFAHAALRAWAGYFAPIALSTNAEWASLNFLSWGGIEPDPDLHGPWRRTHEEAAWRIWAALVVKIYFFRPGKSDWVDGKISDTHVWAIDRLKEWLNEYPPSRMMLGAAPKRGPLSKTGRCTASSIGSLYMEWPSVAAFPNGLVQIEKIELDRNATVSIPAGVASIGSIALENHPDIILPSSLKKIGILDINLHSVVSIPEGVEEIGALTISYNYSNKVTLPSTIRYIGVFDAEAEIYWDGFGEPESGELTDYWNCIEGLEQKGAAYSDNEYAHAVLPDGRQIIKRRKNLVFTLSSQGLNYESILIPRPVRIGDEYRHRSDSLSEI